ncbi:MAG TPA: molybdenum cofactor guanylyltransferase [Ktedonobacterales bacterium]|nr:molybdenum cofactor guanylyltransferase [Ktedonobacterales bacterium]
MARRVSGAVLAGGQSRRMGSDKAALLIEGEPLLRRTVRVLSSITEDVSVIGPPDRATLVSDVPILPDRWPQQGPLGGIATALWGLAGEVVLVVGCDMPFLNLALLRYLIALAPGYDAVVVGADGEMHPLHAVYQHRCLPALEAQLRAGDLRVQRFLSRLVVHVVEGAELDRLDPGHLSTFNANTPDEWKKALRLLSEQ